MLEEMDKKGFVIGIQRKGEPLQYMAQQFIVGFWEAQVNKLSRELVEEFEEYLPSLFDPGTWRKVPQMRTIPVEKSIAVQPEAMPYERAHELVRNHTTFAVSNCICRQEFRVLGKGCDKPEESCLQFGLAAEGVIPSRPVWWRVHFWRASIPTHAKAAASAPSAVRWKPFMWKTRKQSWIRTGASAVDCVSILVAQNPSPCFANRRPNNPTCLRTLLRQVSSWERLAAS
jgi:hypothetical protein